MNPYFTRITKNSIALISVTLVCLLLAMPAFSDDLIHDQQRAYNVELGKYNQTNDKIKRLNADIRVAEAVLEERKKEKADAAVALEDIQSVDRKNPSLGLGDKVQEAQMRNRQAFSDHRQSERKLKQLRGKVIPLDRELKDSTIVLNSLAREIAQLREQIIARELENRIAKLKKTSTVEGYSEVGCGEESLRKCQKRALTSAKRDASEKGSIMVVQAVSHIENFQLTKDQVKTEVQAQLNNVEVLKKGWIGDSTYQYHIRAQVTPVIGTSLKAQMEESISHELGLIVPTAIPQGGSSTAERPQVVAQKSAAEQSFDELERETSGRGTSIEQDERLQRNRFEKAKTKVFPKPEKNPRFQRESWYFLAGINIGKASYPSDFNTGSSDGPAAGADLGFYWPITNSSIYGIVYSGTQKSFSDSDEKGTISRSHLGISALNFLGKPIGKGFFVRVDLGVAGVNLSDDEGFDEDSSPAFGWLAGIGYSLPVGSDSRVLFALNYADTTVSFPDNVNDNADGTYSSLVFNISGLW